MQTLDIILRQDQMPAVTSPPGCSQMRLGSEKQQSHQCIPVLSPDAPPDLTPIQKANPVKTVSLYPCIKHP